MGEFSGLINILSNDPNSAKHTLSISVIVQPPLVPVIAVQETAIDFGTVEAAQPVQKTITITNTGTAPLEITGIESDVPGLTFEPSMFTLDLPRVRSTVTVTLPSSPRRARFRVVSIFRAMIRIARSIPYPCL